MTTRDVPPGDRPRFLSEADCHDIADRLARAATGGGHTMVQIVSRWRGNIRWARNLVSSGGDDRNDHILIGRNVRGAGNEGLLINDVSDDALVAAMRRAEAVVRRQNPEIPEEDIVEYNQHEPFPTPQLFVDATYQLDAEHRAVAAQQLAQSAAAAGMLSAGYIEVSAHSQAFIGSWGYARYFNYTWAQYSVTVRDPKGVGSGWAGVDWPDWGKIDGAALSALALEKCLASRNPVAIEPGRYTTILEPQAVCDLVYVMMGYLLRSDVAHLNGNEPRPGPFNKTIGTSRLGERVVDERLTISADPLDPELGFPPYNNAQWPLWPYGQLRTGAECYRPVTWIEHGVLTNLWYGLEYALGDLGRDTGLYNSGSFRMSGGDTSVAEMITTTTRGLLVTRFDQMSAVGGGCRGYTRDGLWLIEQGKISKPVKNMMFLESVLFALNNVEQLGPPQRAFHPADGQDMLAIPAPVIVPPMKVKDFNFTALSGAI